MSETATPSRAPPGHEPEAFKEPSTTTARSAGQEVPPGHDTGHRRRWIVGAPIAAFVVLVTVIAVVATRGDDGDETATAGGSTTEFSITTEAPTTTKAPATTAAPAPTTTPAPSPGAEGGAALEDGRHAVRITNVDVSGRTANPWNAATCALCDTVRRVADTGCATHPGVSGRPPPSRSLPSSTTSPSRSPRAPASRRCGGPDHARPTPAWRAGLTP